MDNTPPPFIRGKGSLKVEKAEKTTSVSLLSLGKSFSDLGFILGFSELPSRGQTSVDTYKTPYMPTQTHRHSLTHSCYSSAPGKSFQQGFPCGSCSPRHVSSHHNMGLVGVKRKGCKGGIPETVFTPSCTPVPAGPPPRNLQFGTVT